MKKNKKKIIRTITLGITIASCLAANLILPINASSAYITNTEDENSYNKTIVNGSVSVGAIIEFADYIQDYGYEYENERLWLSNQITDNVIYPNMKLYTEIEMISEPTESETISSNGSMIIAKSNNLANPVNKVYNNIEWGIETVENTYITEWSQDGKILLYGPTLRIQEGNPPTTNKIYRIYIEIQDILCYGKNLRKANGFTGENNSIVTAFKLPLTSILPNWEEMTDHDIKMAIIAIGIEGITEQNYYIATNVATGETQEGVLELTKSIDRTNGTITFGLNLPEFDDNEIWKISGIKPIVIASQAEEEMLEIEFLTRYTCLQNSEYLETLLVEKRRIEMPNIVGLGEWVATGVSGFMGMEIYEGITIGGILIMLIAFSVVIWLLKLFAGG